MTFYRLDESGAVEPVDPVELVEPAEPAEPVRSRPRVSRPRG